MSLSGSDLHREVHSAPFFIQRYVSNVKIADMSMSGGNKARGSFIYNTVKVKLVQGEAINMHIVR